ncbi:S-adenosyl-L-methionine-dependent methyltransferase [Aspergillus bertholletiae]|uniref:S-adenosyl-L-methionine-dependent methyltransferase n=1 Tax=Aspergillus bertholletiae TaxID=1226010 RepID=A0A5N7APF6_9EURO|nr:S-adenosyl-L-methionine-dependent methyltransferase [Aspergillus bertholletiae]
MAAPTNPLKDAGVPQHILSLLDRLHAASIEQESRLDITAFAPDQIHDATRGAFIALDQNKCHFVYQLARAINAKNIVEAGTSFGVSTMYLGLAVSANVAASGGPGTVIGTEHEPSKAEQARKYWAEAGELVSRHIDLRVGDLRETLQQNIPTVDMLLLDIWAPMTLPALKAIQPHLRHGAVVIIDNTISSAGRYKDLLAYLRQEKSGFTNLTIPYSNGLELCVYAPQS